MKINLEKLKACIKSSYSYAEVSDKYFGFTNGKSIKAIQNAIGNYTLDNSHFNNRKKMAESQRKYKIIEKECPVCGIKFLTKQGHKSEKTTCGRKCANTHFLSGQNNGRYKDGMNGYKTLCFKHHPRKCLVCDEMLIIEVHHIDKNRKNNTKDNLIPLCPTHHRYMLSKHSNIVLDKIKNILSGSTGT